MTGQFHPLPSDAVLAQAADLFATGSMSAEEALVTVGAMPAVNAAIEAAEVARAMEAAAEVIAALGPCPCGDGLECQCAEREWRVDRHLQGLSCGQLHCATCEEREHWRLQAVDAWDGRMRVHLDSLGLDMLGLAGADPVASVQLDGCAEAPGDFARLTELIGWVTTPRQKAGRSRPCPCGSGVDERYCCCDPRD
jgi:hypothetical protein